jgi:hypothetical protein
MGLIEKVTALLIADGVSQPAIEMVQEILEWPDLVAQYEGRRGTLYIDYAPGQPELRVDKLKASPASRMALSG